MDLLLLADRRGMALVRTGNQHRPAKAPDPFQVSCSFCFSNIVAWAVLMVSALVFMVFWNYRLCVITPPGSVPSGWVNYLFWQHYQQLMVSDLTCIKGTRWKSREGVMPQDTARLANTTNPPEVSYSCLEYCRSELTISASLQTMQDLCSKLWHIRLIRRTNDTAQSRFSLHSLTTPSSTRLSALSLIVRRTALSRVWNAYAGPLPLGSKL